MSRFWAAGGASDSDESDSSDGSSSSSSEESQKNADNKWVMSDDSESEDEVRIAKSAKTRTFESLQTHIDAIRNAMKIRDFSRVQSEFDAMTSKTMSSQKTKSIIEAHGGVPRFFVRVLVDLEDFVAKSLKDKAAVKKLSATNGRALNRMKLTLKKYNAQYEKLIKEYRHNPVLSEDDTSHHKERSTATDDDDGDDDADSDDASTPTTSSSEKKAVTPKNKKVDSDLDSDSNAVSSSSSEDSDSDASSDNDDDDEDSYDSAKWASSSDDDESTDTDDEVFGELKGRARWLKSTVVVQKRVKPDKDIRAKERAETKRLAAAARAVSEAAVQGGVVTSKTVLPEVNLTPSILDRKVRELIGSRGRRGTDKKFILRQLESLAKMASPFGPRVEVPILMHVITAQFDLQRTIDDFMDTPTWKSCAGYLTRIANILERGHKKYTLVPVIADDDMAADMMVDSMTGKGVKMKAAAGAGGDAGAMEAVAADEKLINPQTGDVETADERAERVRLEKESVMSEEQLRTIPANGSLSLFLTRLDEEYIKCLQRTSPHTDDYVIRLRDEAKLVILLAKVQQYFQRIDSKPEAAELAQLRVEHLYYRHDTIAVQVDRASKFFEKFGESTLLHPSCITNSDGGKDFTKIHPGAVNGKPSVPDIEKVDSAALISDLCTYVYQFGTDRSRTRAMLCHIYHYALHDRFLEARDLLLMSHLQDTIVNVGDVSTMILFNRMMVTLGLAAFRLGKVWDAHQCLSDICSGRVRELLAQGVSTGRFSDKTAEQEKAEKRRQVPYHQHINLDLLEACHLISAMLLEVPNMAAAGVDDAGGSRRIRVISRTFRKNYDIYERQVFTGPPEQTRDFVMKATKALMTGDWRKCASHLTNLDVWQLVPGDNVVEQICLMLVEKIKLEGLRTYLFAFSSHYDSLSLSQLCNMFDLSRNEVHSVVSKMMINRELFACWDQPTETIVLRKIEPSQLQVLALQFADKAANLVEANERLLDAKSGNFNFKDSDGKWKSGGGGDHQQRTGHYQNNQGRGGGARGSYRGNDGSGRGGSVDRTDGRGRARSGGRGRGRGSNRASQNQNQHRSW